MRHLISHLATGRQPADESVTTSKERNKLIKVITKGSTSAKMIMHANVLLAADE